MLRLFSKPINNLSDEDLFRGSVSGRDDMFEVLYKRYKQRLLYYFYRMLGNNEQLSQDFTQELFFKILNKHKLYNPSKKFSTWIFSIAHNMCKNEYRSREVRNIIVKSDSIEQFEASNDTAKPPPSELIHKIYAELDSMEESHRTVFILKYREGFDNNEISEILDIPVGTIKSRLHYTRKVLAKQLQAINHNEY